MLYEQRLSLTASVICSLVGCFFRFWDTLRPLTIMLEFCLWTIAPRLTPLCQVFCGTRCRIFDSTRLWVLDFLLGRQQCVKVGQPVSKPLSTNIGVPQCCVLSPFLFIMYTNDCVSDNSIWTQRKWFSIDRLTEWYANNHLELNTGNTKEMVFDIRRFSPAPV